MNVLGKMGFRKVLGGVLSFCVLCLATCGNDKWRNHHLSRVFRRWQEMRHGGLVKGNFCTNGFHCWWWYWFRQDWLCAYDTHLWWGSIPHDEISTSTHQGDFSRSNFIIIYCPWWRAATRPFSCPPSPSLFFMVQQTSIEMSQADDGRAI